eukprot:764419-Hanusia_phi.AAC.6
MLLQSFWITTPKSDALLSKAPSLERRSMAGRASMTELGKKLTWIETVSQDPRIFIIHNLLTEDECDHLVALALKKGLSASLITPYGTNKLVESTTRTNKQAWLDFQQDDIVKRIEDKIAKITKTTPEQGENLQVRLCSKASAPVPHPAPSGPPLRQGAAVHGAPRLLRSCDGPAGELREGRKSSDHSHCLPPGLSSSSPPPLAPPPCLC